MTEPNGGPGPLTLRIVAAILLGNASFAVTVEPGRLAVFGFAATGAAMAGVCLWLAHWLDQVKRAERRRKERIRRSVNNMSTESDDPSLSEIGSTTSHRCKPRTCDNATDATIRRRES